MKQVYTTSREYRPDIDGLRAVAVLAILFYHAGYDWARGGFVGVDVFFVISGFLITRNILGELAAGKFSFFEFYSRRIRRLFPALFVVLVLSGIVGLLLCAPADLERLSDSTLSALFSLANFFFWYEAGYFDPDAGTKPLLHTWSLSLEEQFYLLWPALIVVIWRFRQGAFLVPCLIVMAVLSLVASQGALFDNASASFFLLPFRAFEFAIGAGCVWCMRWRPWLRYANNALVGIGLALVLWCVITYSLETPFPGILALLPCLGSALVIFAGKETLLARFVLANRFSVGIGLISYSVYLVHWPLFTFYRYFAFGETDEAERIVLLAVTLLLSCILWRFVERPFRKRNGYCLWPRTFRYVAMTATILLALGALWTRGQDGWPGRFPREYFMSLKQFEAEELRYWEERERLFKGDPGAKTVLVMGNSHAVDLMYALKLNGSKSHIVYFGTTHNCVNLIKPKKTQYAEFCGKLAAHYFSRGVWKRVDAVYLHDHWRRNDMEEFGSVLATIRGLTSAPIYVFGPKMTYSETIPDIVREHMRRSSLNDFAKKFEKNEFKVELNRALRAMLNSEPFNKEQIYFIDVLATQCGEAIDGCKIISEIDGNFLYFDKEHFTRQGSAEFGRKLKEKHPELF